MALKPFVKDKSNWRKMLTNEVELSDLVNKKNSLLKEVSGLIDDHDAQTLPNDVVNIDYPVIKYPTKIVSLSFDKTPNISGILEGIKGQYLLLDSGVLNLRKFSSYHIGLSSL